MFDTLADAFGTTLTSVDGLQSAHFRTDERPIARHNTGTTLESCWPDLFTALQKKKKNTKNYYTLLIDLCHSQC